MKSRESSVVCVALCVMAFSLLPISGCSPAPSEPPPTAVATEAAAVATTTVATTEPTSTVEITPTVEVTPTSEVIATEAAGGAAAPDEGRMDMLAAFDQALLKLTFTAVKGGDSFEILVQNKSSNPLRLFLAEGVTSFTDQIQIASSARQNIDVPANGETTITVGQAPGGNRVLSGSVTIARSSPKQ